MNQLIIISSIAVLIIILPLLVLFLWWNFSFKYTARIARQVGQGTNDVIWTEEKFKVKYEDGLYVITFKLLQDRTPLQTNTLWSKFIHKKYQKKSLTYPKDEWEAQNIKSKILSGIHFYEPEKGTLLPMDISFENGVRTFRVLNQDQRWFNIKAIRDANALTRDKKRELITTLVLVVGMIVFGIVFVFGIIYMTDHAQTTIGEETQVCAGMIKALFTNSTTNGQPTFLNNMVQQTVGG